MFDIFLKKSKIVVDCFTTNSVINDLHPIAPASSFYPEWWKRLESTVMVNGPSGILRPEGTIKRCDGLLDLYKHGFVIPLWSDLIIETTEDGSYRYQFPTNGNPPITNHLTAQMGPAFEKLMHIKIISPWVAEEKSGVKFSFNQPTWSMLNYFQDIVTVPGVINYRDQISTHINTFVPRKNNRLEFEAGQPLAHVIPISDKKVEIKTHVISISEFDFKLQRLGYQTKWFGNYKMLSKMTRRS
jgi:hypothetical protein